MVKEWVQEPVGRGEAEFRQGRPLMGTGNGTDVVRGSVLECVQHQLPLWPRDERLRQDVRPQRTLTPVAVSTAGRMTSAARYATNGTVVNSVNYGFDVQGRQASVTDSRNGTSQMSFNVADLVMSMTTPAPGNGQPAQTSSTEYDTSLRAWRSTQPDGTTVTNEYFVTGALKKTYGSRTYPVEDT